MMPPAGSKAIGVSQLCWHARVSRRSYYRYGQDHLPRQSRTELRDAVHSVALAHRVYGYRRVTAALHHQGLFINQKVVRSIMKTDNLLSLRRRKYVLTTDSSHTLMVYPNLSSGLQLTGCDQLWVSDITFIRLRETFIYLAVVIDAWSRRVVGWALGDRLSASLALAALDKALSDRKFSHRPIHHSDRGSQYCSREYVQRLEAAGFQISMSRRGNPYDNAKAESFMKTLKAEEVHLNQYRDLADAQARIGAFVEEVYNRTRMHSALGYLSPEQFERRALAMAASSS